MKKWMTMALFLCLSVVSQGVLRADDLSAVKKRMQERIPAMEALKHKQVVGENNRGFLEFVGAAKEQEASVKAENQDREAVYKEIAEKSQTSVELVGQRRAQKIAKKAAKGTMIQDATGAWAPKK